jgi:predicted phage tail component-like protein
MGGFTYRGRHSSELGVHLLTYTVYTPDTREYEDEADGRPGAYDYGSEWGKREIVLKVDISPSDEPVKRRQSSLINWLRPTLPAGILVFDEIPDRFYFAKLTGRLSMEQFGRYGTFEWTMKCTDPFAYGPERIFENTFQVSPYAVSILSEGTESTPPLIELTNVGSTTVNGFRIVNEYPVEE